MPDRALLPLPAAPPPAAATLADTEFASRASIAAISVPGSEGRFRPAAAALGAPDAEVEPVAAGFAGAPAAVATTAGALAAGSRAAATEIWPVGGAPAAAKARARETGEASGPLLCDCAWPAPCVVAAAAGTAAGFCDA